MYIPAISSVCVSECVVCAVSACGEMKKYSYCGRIGVGGGHDRDEDERVYMSR